MYISDLRDFLKTNGFHMCKEKWHNNIYYGFTLENNKMILHFTDCYKLKKIKLKEV